MLISPFATISRISLLSPTLFVVFSCQATQTPTPGLEAIQEGAISFPFVEETRPIGQDARDDRLIIRSVHGNAETILEIPHSARDYDIAVPLSRKNEEQAPAKAQNPQLTDRELLSSLPGPSEEQARDRSALETAMGLSEEDGPNQGPSYTLGLAKIIEYYKARNFEFALIEVNQLLSFYPNAPRLYKMKGTILIKTGDLALAAKAWTRALELDGDDQALQKNLQRLEQNLQKKRQRDPLPKDAQPKSSRRPPRAPKRLQVQ